MCVCACVFVCVCVCVCVRNDDISGPSHVKRNAKKDG